MATSLPPQKNTPMKFWILLVGLFLVVIATIILIKSSLLNSQTPAAIVTTSLLGAVGVIGTLFSVLALIFPDSTWFPSSAWLTSMFTPTFNNPRRVKSINIVLLIIGIIGIFVASLIPYPSPPPKPAPTARSTPTLIPTPTPTPCTGKPTDGSIPFAVYPNYDPSGYVGDTGDITVAKGTNLVRFTYITRGQGPYEWDYKYIGGKLNPNPSRFAGVLYLNPPNNWGTDSHCGFDLRGRHVLKWEARSLSGPVNVEFVIGGVVWMWDDKTQTRVPVPYPDSMPRTSFATQPLTQDWQTFQYDLSRYNITENYLRDVVAGFGWVITWDSNGGQFAGSGQPKTFIIEIQGISYER